MSTHARIAVWHNGEVLYGVDVEHDGDRAPAMAYAIRRQMPQTEEEIRFAARLSGWGCDECIRIEFRPNSANWWRDTMIVELPDSA